MNTLSFISRFVTVVGLFSLVIGSTAFAQEYKKVTRLGTSQSVCTGGVETVAELQSFFASNPERIRSIVADAGWAGSADDLLAAVAAGQVTETAYPVGTRMAWMGAKVNGQYVANDYREWAGNQSMEAYRVDVSSGCQVYHMAIPKACCNVSLISVAPDTSEACRPTPPPVAPAPEPEPVVEKAAPLALIPFFGAFAGSETRPRFEDAWQMDIKDSSGIIGLRAGLKKEISERTGVFGQLSYYDRQGINEFNNYPENNLALDIGVERKLSEKAYIGGGIGAWNIDDSDFRDPSLFAHVAGDIGASNLQWFLEGRLFDSDSDLDSISDNKMFSLGLRYLVK
ncbi:MAG: hypothetical protein KTR16_00125 [Acidiferrobacterales bacterium]|nr:hypothetical protein [Acidiferrobacterales bacterium]